MLKAVHNSANPSFVEKIHLIIENVVLRALKLALIIFLAILSYSIGTFFVLNYKTHANPDKCPIRLVLIMGDNQCGG